MLTIFQFPQTMAPPSLWFATRINLESGLDRSCNWLPDMLHELEPGTPVWVDIHVCSHPFGGFTVYLTARLAGCQYSRPSLASSFPEPFQPP